MRSACPPAWLLACAAIGAVGVACNVDMAGLDEASMVPRDAGAERPVGSAGASGTSGGAGAGGSVAPDVDASADADVDSDADVDAGGSSDAGDAGAAGGATGWGGAGGGCGPCAPCQVCGANGACGIDPSSRWTIVAVSAELTPLSPSAMPWDPAGVSPGSAKPDPFAEFEMPPGDLTNAGVTSTIADSFTAAWNEPISPAGPGVLASDLLSTNASRWVIWVGDDEFNGNGTIACQIHPPMQEAWLRSGQLSLQALQSCKSVTIGLVCQR